MIKFVIGIMLGGTICFFTAAILAAGKWGDEYEL
jgi:gas vesicle protein